MKLIKLAKKTKHKTEQMELVISIVCMVSGIKLSETDIKVLAYFVIHGVKKSTDALLVNSGVTKIRNLDNIKTRLTRLGFLRKTKDLYKSYELNISKDFTNDNIMNLLIQIDNT